MANPWPNLSLWSISTSTSQSKVGYGCFNGDFTQNPFSAKTGSGTTSAFGSDNFTCENFSNSRSYSISQRLIFSVEENSYSISEGSSEFKDDYFAIDCGEFNNDNQSLVGQAIKICYTIDKIDSI